jgi:hypothetical protein
MPRLHKDGSAVDPCTTAQKTRTDPKDIFFVTLSAHTPVLAIEFDLVKDLRKLGRGTKMRGL